MTDQQRVDDWIRGGGRPDTDLELRLIRRVPGLAESLEQHLIDPIERALAGLGLPSVSAGSLADRVRLGVAGFQYTVGELAELEEEAKIMADPHLWIMAARLHAEKNIGREAAARMSLSDQVLPYVFPGEMHPMMVDLLATGERVIPALHVDWIRKLTVWVAAVLAHDCKCMGMWFWPILQCLDAGKLKRPIAQLSGRTLPGGGRGLAAVYATRAGIPSTELESSFTDRDRLIVALARLGDQLL